MRALFQHRTAPAPGRTDDELPHRVRPISVTDRACCCPARPVVTVIMPPAAGRPHPVDLLLCGHHYRVSRAALKAAGVTVYDEAGAPVTAGTGEQQPPCCEPAAAVLRR
jgi:hypothetical protein